MLEIQHRCAEISADRSIPIPHQPPHLLHFDTTMFPYQKEKMIQGEFFHWSRPEKF